MDSKAIPTTTQWRKSSYSSDQGGDCLEVAETRHATVAVRDSKTPAGPILTLAPAAFTTFVDWARSSRTP
ncbi:MULTISPECIES: DUF397 domain-containing protein [Streptomyces]|uniref:DUF397 domain-containing protein n=1 Tax=Streptomyces TaxID=1883 RepID=UPI0013DBD5A6|nr:DUF397 domain-containing protein [Streptomyces salinarius]